MGDKLTLTEVLDSINLKVPIDYNKDNCKDVSMWVILKFYSQETDCIDIVNEINDNMYYIPEPLVYKILFDKIPAGRRYIKYTRAIKKVNNYEEKIELLMKEYGISNNEARMSLI